MPGLKAVGPPPQTENGRRRLARQDAQRRARQAVRILERGKYVSDQVTYGSKPSARDKAKRLIDALVEHQYVPREHLHHAVRIVHTAGRVGFRWWVWLNEEPGARGPRLPTHDEHQAPADKRPARGRSRVVTDA